MKSGMVISPIKHSNPRGTLYRLSCESAVGVARHRHGDYCMLDYQKDPNFNRNQAIFILSTIEKKTPEEIAQQFSLSVPEVKSIIAVHTEYEAKFH